MKTAPLPEKNLPEAGTSFIKRKQFDIAYAEISKAQKLDIYWPEEGDGPFPVILSVHGGAFRGGDKRDMQLTPMLKGLYRGYAVTYEILLNAKHGHEEGLFSTPANVNKVLDFIDDALHV